MTIRRMTAFAKTVSSTPGWTRKIIHIYKVLVFGAKVEGKCQEACTGVDGIRIMPRRHRKSALRRPGPEPEGLRNPDDESAITRQELANHCWSLHECARIRLTGLS